MKQRRRGQALVEYMLAVLLCLGVSGVVGAGIKTGVGKLWLMLAKDIAPGCPGCDLPPELGGS